MLLHQLKGERVGVCVSGGLDSKTVTTRLKQAGVDVMCFTADLAQPDEADINDIIEKMRPTGAETIIVDLKPDMAEACYTMIQAQASYDGGYWNTTGIARAVTVRGLIAEMKKHGCTVLAHGATGRGNDQLRFERYTNVLAPEMPVYAPWRDPVMLKQFPGRREMVAFLQEQGIEAQVGPRKRYSTDANLAGVSHEAEDLEDLQTSSLIVEPVMGVWPMQAPDDVETVTVRFEQGRCVAINGKHVTPYEAMVAANTIGGRNGLGLRSACENRVIGTKSRGVYEAPGLELLGYCMRSVYQVTMDRTSAKMFHELSKLLADHIYDGRYFDPSARAARAAIAEMAQYATGTVEVGLYKGNIFFQGQRDCPSSLYNPADASMEASDGLNPVSSQGYVEIQAVSAIAMANAGQIKNEW
ncbi:MAG: argininosuccinate synthase [Myxococcales bacterium]|nr:argininosuccinate synthase [Myxococcales bacterium]